MKALKYWIFCVVLVFVVASCRSTKPATSQSETQMTTVTETLHDTIFRTLPDTATYKALLECQNGKVLINSLVDKSKGSYLKAPKISLQDNILQVDCEAQAQRLFAQWKNKHTLEQKEKIITQTKYINQLTFWQELKLKMFWLLFIVVSLYTIYKLKFK